MLLKYLPLLWLGYATSNIYFVCVASFDFLL